MKEFWDSLTKEQQGALAASVDSVPGYLRLVFNDYKKTDFNLAKELENVTSDQIIKYDLWPDIYSKR